MLHQYALPFFRILKRKNLDQEREIHQRNFILFCDSMTQDLLLQFRFLSEKREMVKNIRYYSRLLLYWIKIQRKLLGVFIFFVCAFLSDLKCITLISHSILPFFVLIFIPLFVYFHLFDQFKCQKSTIKFYTYFVSIIYYFIFYFFMSVMLFAIRNFKN